MTNEPSGRAIGAAKLQTGIPGLEPLAAIGRPAASKTCHAREPPRDHAVPSVHTNSTSPPEFTARRGCLRVVPSPGAAIGAEMRASFASIRPKYTWPVVSHAANVAVGLDAIDMLVIGHAPMSHGCTLEPRNDFP